MTYFVAFILENKFERAYLFKYSENNDTIEPIEERRLKTILIVIWVYICLSI
jgi:hypothetical protein